MELRIDERLRGAEGPLEVTGTTRWTFRTYGPFRLKGAGKCWSWSRSCPWGPIVLETTNPVAPKSLKAAIAIEPAAAIDWERAEVSQERVELVGEFVPGTRYQISMAKGAKDAFGQALGEPWKDSVKLSDLDPELDAGGGIALLEAKGDGLLPAKTVNVDELELALRPLDVAEMARLLASEKEADQ